MLRNFIKKIIPSRGDIFFTLFEESAILAKESAKILVDILDSQNESKTTLLHADLKIQKQKASTNNRRVVRELNRMFITPIDRGDIQRLSSILYKLNKKIVKTAMKLQVFNIDANTDNCLIKSANTLLLSMELLTDAITGLKEANQKKISIADDRINELEENTIEDLHHSINEMSSGKFDIPTILKIESIRKNIDSAIESSVLIADIAMQISLKSI